MQKLWTEVDDYLGEMFAPPDAALKAALQSSRQAGLPAIQVSPLQGKLLQLLAMIQRAQTILEIGVLGGYSTIHLARALPAGGRLVSLEANQHHAEVARANLRRAGLEARVEIRLGSAVDTLAQMVAQGAGPFDLVFIDADKPSYPEYLAWSLKLSRPGTLLIADNVVRNGAVADPGSPDADVQGARRFLELLAAEPRLQAVVAPSAGRKGYDGIALAVVV